MIHNNIHKDNLEDLLESIQLNLLKKLKTT